ncbi:SDR family oxidoreductase [Haladaptatus salinisoli]|uniref:SDR family oxidoreductase n=1 Tax=Haladaptatus salinisoli TaxID=2884876 RepID=UPI001D0A8452|nr:SDR family oxidoreductase [Haladaptatus salinisoli]
MTLNGKVAAVTGAGSGMGRSTARLFAERGADVVVVDLDGNAATETASAIEDAAGGSAVPVTADVSDADDVAGFVELTVKEFGRIDILHNNAGIPQQSTPIEDITEEVWDRIQNVNLKSAFLGAKYAVPHMREQGGVILNTASTAGIRPRTGLSAYCASKGGMITLTKQLAYELAEDGIRVNAICPVATDTDMLPEFAAGDLSVESMRETIPLGRLAEPQDVAHAAVFLASNEAAMVTGTALEVDGGRDI